MDWIGLVSLFLRLIGLAGWAGRWEQARKAKQTAQSVANTPTTNEEWTHAAQEGDL